MSMNKVPTLLVGLGGIGCKIAQMIYDKLSNEDRKYIGIIGMDTNAEDLKVLTIPFVQTSDAGKVADYIMRHPEYATWFPFNKYTGGHEMLTGAGQIRAISRLAALSAIEQGKFRILEEEIGRILQHKPEIDYSSFNLFLVGSITGGTGAGLFLQMPFYVKELLKKQYAIDKVRVRGMFISADITARVQTNPINEEAVKVNAYACMKELNAFYLMQNFDEKDNHLRLEYYRKPERSSERGSLRDKLTKAWGDSEFGFDPSVLFNQDQIDQESKAITESGIMIPYDAFYLIEGSDNRGGIGNANLETVEKQIAKILYVMLFTPVKAAAEGAQNNYVLEDMEKGGMNRYNSAGLCTLRYPYKEMMEYVNLSWVRDLVKEEWLYLDKKVENEKRANLELQKTNPGVRVLDTRVSYAEMFEEEMEGGEDKKLGFLKEQAFRSTESAESKDGDDLLVLDSVCRLDKLFDNVTERIGEILDSNDMNSAISACDILEDDFKKTDMIQQEIRRVYHALAALKETAEAVINTHRFRIADEVFSPNMETFRLDKKNEKNIFGLFSKVHPVVGRYFCYKAINRLEDEIERLEASALTVPQLDNYKRTDFYETEDDGIQKADVAAELYIQKIVPVIRLGEKKLDKLRNQFRDMRDEQVATILAYCSDTLELRTYILLKKRFEALSKLYEGFFSNLRSQIEQNEERADLLEKSYMEDPIGEKMVYASPQAFRRTYAEFKGMVDYELPMEACYAVADGLFRMAYITMTQEGQEMTFQQEQENKKNFQRELKNVFQTGVLDSMMKTVIEKGDAAVNITIRQALEKEYKMHNQSYEASEREHEKNRIAYARKNVEDAMVMAVPMLAARPVPDATEIVFLAMHPGSAEMSAGEPDGGVTQQRLAPVGTPTDLHVPHVILDEEFSPYEIICMKTKHNCTIEELVKYGTNGDYAEAYRRRIKNLGTDPSVSGKDAFKTVVNPHLDRFWHEEGFIPEFGEEERMRSEMDTRKAFIYSMAWDLFQRNEIEGIKRWHYVNGAFQPFPVKKTMRLIDNTYVDLYDALKYNRSIKTNILSSAKARIEMARQRMDPENMMADALASTLVEDMAQSIGDDLEDQNIFDIFSNMYYRMEQTDWESLFDALSQVLEEYFKKIFGEDRGSVNETYQRAIIKIAVNSQYGIKISTMEEYKKDGKSLSGLPALTKAEEAVKVQATRILNMRIF